MVGKVIFYCSIAGIMVNYEAGFDCDTDTRFHNLNTASLEPAAHYTTLYGATKCNRRRRIAVKCAAFHDGPTTCFLSSRRSS